MLRKIIYSREDTTVVYDYEFIEAVKDGEYILENLKESNRFDYNQASYTFTKFGNISEGIIYDNCETTEITKWFGVL